MAYHEPTHLDDQCCNVAEITVQRDCKVAGEVVPSKRLETGFSITAVMATGFAGLIDLH